LCQFHFLSISQLLAGLSKPTSGSIHIQRYGNDGNPNQSPELLTPERVGIVFQFPERYLLLIEGKKSCFPLLIKRILMLHFIKIDKINGIHPKTYCISNLFPFV